MEVFISWSGQRSRILAVLLADLLSRLINPTRPWLSATSLRKGDRWLQVIGDKLANVSRGIICVTPENQNAPWLLFEAGALSKAIQDSRVCPLVLGMDLADLQEPLSQFQAAAVTHADMYALILSLNKDLGANAIKGHILEEEFEAKWPRFEANLERELGDVAIPPGDAFGGILDALTRHGVSQPEIGKTAYFTSGFESHGLYTAAASTAKRRLYIFGRKNRKLFDKEHDDFLGKLKTRINTGLEFKCLFLSPSSPSYILTTAHEDADFCDQLQRCIDKAVGFLRTAGIDPNTVLRTYNINRESACVIVDDAVMFTPIEHTPQGVARRLTKCGFAITSSTTSLGNNIVSEFERVWAVSQPITNLP